MKYDSFISYSHSADGRLAPAVQAGLQRLAKPWYRRRALRVFRDETGLAVDPHMWASIINAMDESRYFVLLASPEAAASPSVNREITHWLQSHPAETLLPVLTDGTLTWSSARGGYDPAHSSALPPALQGAHVAEPRHLDLRWARNETQLDLRHSRFRSEIATLAAPIHGIAREDLEGEDIRLHRRAMRLAITAIAGIITLTLAAVIAGGLAVLNARQAQTEKSRAQRNTLIALSRQLAATSLVNIDTQDNLALLQAVTATRILPTVEARNALMQAVAAHPEVRVEFHPARGLGTKVWSSPGGETIATANADGDMQFWDAVTGTLRAETHVARTADERSGSAQILEATFGPENTIAIAWSSGGQGGAPRFTFVDTATGKVRASISAIGQNPTRLAFSRDGRWFAAPTTAGVIGVWDLAGTPPKLIQAYAAEGPIGAIALSPDGRTLAWTDVTETSRSPSSAQWTNSILIQHLDDNRQIGPIEINRGADQIASGEGWATLSRDGSGVPFALSFSADGQTLMSIAQRGSNALNYLDPTTGTRLQTRAVTSGTIIAASPDQRLLALRTPSGSVAFEKLSTGEPVGSAIQEPVSDSLAFTSGASSLATVSSDGSVKVIDIVPGAPISRTQARVEVPEHDQYLSELSPDGGFIAVADTIARHVSIIDTHTGRVRRELRDVLGLGTFSEWDAHFAFVTSDRTLRVLNLTTGRIRAVRRGREAETFFPYAFRPDRRTIAVTVNKSGRSRVEYWDSVTGRRSQTRSPFRLDSGGIADLAFSRDGTLAVLVGRNIDPTTSRIVLLPPNRPSRTVHGVWTTVSFSRDGHTLAAVEDGGFVQGPNASVDLFQVPNARRIGSPLSPRGGPSGITSMALAPRGDTIATGTDDGTIQLWDAASTAPIGPGLTGDGNPVHLAFTKTGRLMSADLPNPGQIASHGVFVWGLDTRSLVRKACARATRTLTRNEWRQLVGSTLPYDSPCPAYVAG